MTSPIRDDKQPVPTQNDSAAGYGAERNGLSPADLGELERLATEAADLCAIMEEAHEPAWMTASDLRQFPPEDAAFIAAASPSTILALISRLRAAEGALREIADPSSPHDKTGEPIHVRMANDLTRRIEIARSALPHPVGEGT